MIEALMTVLSVLRTYRWGLHDLNARLHADAVFLSGLLIEAGWLAGSEMVPRSDVIYMVFERSRLGVKRYLEIVLGDSREAVARISEQSEGRILSDADAPVKTRFLVLAGEGDDAWDADNRGEFLSPDQFVVRFTGVSPLPSPPNDASRGSLADEIVGHLVPGGGNVLVYGPPGAGKSRALRELAARGWPGAPAVRFLVDYAESDAADVEETLDRQLASRFPADVRPRTRELVSYLVRTGRAALVLDSIECATAIDQPLQVARTFARLCAFLSDDSTVIMAGRDAALRDSATIREFVMGEPAVSEVLAQTFRSTGVDYSRLPRLRMVRARRSRSWEVTTPHDRLIRALSVGIWDHEERAARRLADVLDVQCVLGRSACAGPELTRQQVQSLALGCLPPEPLRPEDSMFGIDACHHRALRELSAAVDYIRAAIFGTGLDRWIDLAVGEGTRRLVRLLSPILLADEVAGEARLALVGPSNCVIAVSTAGQPRLQSVPVTVGEYREFLRAVPSLPSLDLLSPRLPDEGHLIPLHNRVLDGLYRDDTYLSYPAVAVSWWGADSFARWSGSRLPTSLEWEIAGRGWDGRIFPWGDDHQRGLINCADRSARTAILEYGMWRDAMRRGDIVPRGSEPPDVAGQNRSPNGQLDMVGNVWEWVDTSVDRWRVIAGGSYDNPVRACVLSSRSIATPDTRSNAVGFRVVAS